MKKFGILVLSIAVCGSLRAMSKEVGGGVSSDSNTPLIELQRGNDTDRFASGEALSESEKYGCGAECISGLLKGALCILFCLFPMDYSAEVNYGDNEPTRQGREIRGWSDPFFSWRWMA